MSILKWAWVAVPLMLGWFFLLELIAPGHWGFFQTYFGATWGSLWSNVSNLLK